METAIKLKLRFNRTYFILTLLLFIIEVLIAIYICDKFIRPYVGDFLVVILIYCFVKTFFNFPTVKLALAVLLFSYFIETLQYLQLLNYLGLQNNTMAKIVLGSSFSWMDMLVYTLGIFAVILVEKASAKNQLR